MLDSFVDGFIIYTTYRIVEERSFVYLFGRLRNAESFLAICPYEPYFFIKKKDKDKIHKSLKEFSATVEDTDLRNFEDKEVSRIICKVPNDVVKMRKYLENEMNVECYEADIRFHQRFLIDLGIKGSLQIKGSFKKGDFVDRIYESPQIRPSEWVPELKVLSIDIETDQRARQIYCISLYTEGFEGKDAYKKVLLVATDKDIGKRPLTNAISFNTEKEMLQRFSELIKEIDPDVITGWHVIDFDLRTIKDKFTKYNIPFTLGRADWPCKIETNSDFMRDSSADFPGRQVLDGIHLMRTSFVKLENYKLDTAAKTYLGDKKLIGGENKSAEIDRLYRHDQQKLVDYNLKDSELVYKLIYKTSSMQLTVQRSMITGMTLDRVKASVASLDSLFLRYSRARKLVVNNSKFSEKDEPSKGGYVMESKPGIYDYVIVLDFKSLYPSIIRTLNIDPYSYVKHPGKTMDRKLFVRAENGAIFKNQLGILPVIIEDVWKQRDEAKKQKKPAHVIYALKIIMNSFYGVLGNPSCRFFNPEMSNAITYTGEHIIKLTTKKVEELGYEVIYGDTDSIFVVSKATDAHGAQKVGKQIEKYINDFYSKYTLEQYNRESFLEIQFEKLFKVFLMPTVRGSEEGAKKRYAGVLIRDGAEEISFTGMEFVRGDWTDLAKKFQLELFDLIFNKQPVEEYIKRFVADLRKGTYDDLLVYKKSITKSLSAYTKTTPPHVKAARQLSAITSSQIHYLMTLQGPEPMEKLKHKPDYEHYIDKQIKPIADTILPLYSKSFDDILAQSRQTKLFGF